MTIPPAWIEAGAKAIRDDLTFPCGMSMKTDAGREAVFCDDPRITGRTVKAGECACKVTAETALAAVLPLVVIEMLSAMHQGRKPGATWSTHQAHEAVRAWARERGVKLEGEDK